MDNSAKILLLGKTGVGKSAFINYFLGKELAKTGVGKPVTQEITSYELTDGKLPIEIFDSKGIEAKTADEQKGDIISEVKKRNNDEDVFNWFHTIFYCTSAEKHFEDFEADFIKKLKDEISQHIHIILTKCDMVEKKVIQDMRETIKSKFDNKNIEIFEIVSVNAEHLDGTKVEQSGKEILLERVFELLWEDISYKLSLDYAKSLRKSFIEVADDTLSKATKLIDEVVSLKMLIELIKDENKANIRFDELTNDIENDLNDAQKQADLRFNKILKPAAELYASYKGEITNNYFAEDADLAFADWDIEKWTDVFGIFEDDDAFMKKIMPALAKNGYIKDGDFIDFENASFWKVLGAIGAGIGDLLTLKGRLKNLGKYIHNEFKKSLPSEDEIQKETYKRIIDYIKV
ncbi:MAG: GTPase domain-containing protein [Ruminococcus sp.]|nr:GTPase domain-containing protein [Ruminococcus sp.]MCM1478717.1 GTPase domain-containing protein [Muribaculaceae bacterium]